MNPYSISETCSLFNVKLVTSIGPMEINGCDQGLHSVVRPQPLASSFSSKEKCFEITNVDPGKIPKPMKQALDWYGKYFNGTLVENFDPKTLPICPEVKFSNIARKTYEKLLANVKMGHHCTYSELAEMIGQPKAQRAVGNALRLNPVYILIPCHRVIRKTGATGKYGGKEDPTKQWLLDHEKSIIQ